jgi:hypothetical protein
MRRGVPSTALADVAFPLACDCPGFLADSPLSASHKARSLSPWRSAPLVPRWFTDFGASRTKCTLHEQPSRCRQGRNGPSRARAAPSIGVLLGEVPRYFPDGTCDRRLRRALVLPHTLHESSSAPSIRAFSTSPLVPLGT